MAFQLAVAVRNAMLDAIETAVAAQPIMRIRTGSPPANCAAADTGSVLATVNLPVDWMGSAASGSKSKAGTWEDTSADATGTAAHFRIYDNATGLTCFIQGTVTASGGGGDMTVDNTSFTAGQAFSVTTFTLTAGNS